MNQLKQKLDNFLALPSFSSEDLIDILDFLKQTNEEQFINDTQAGEHKIYCIFTNLLKDLLNKWCSGDSFTQFEASYLFPSLIELFYKMNYTPTDLVEPLKNCLENITKQDTKHLSILAEMYNQVLNPCRPSIFVSNQHRNQEDITLIWYDENIDAYDQPEEKIKLLQSVNNYVVICSDMNTCSTYINQIRTEKVFIILSGRTADEMLNKIHDFRQVHSIYKFSMCINEHDDKKRKYDKVAGIHSEFEPLLEVIQENINSMTNQSQVTSLFGQYERSIRSLDSESHIFIEFCLFKYILLKLDFDREYAKNEMIEACRNYYQGNTVLFGQVDDFEQNYHPNDVIRWYTADKFVYRLINKALRTEDYESLWTLRFFIIDLYENIRLKYEASKGNPSTIVTYRGCKCTPDDVYSLKCNIGKTIATNSFLSTSRLNFVAEIFSGQGTNEPGFEPVVLEFHSDTMISTAVFADISQYSIFGDQEQEVLFAFGATFTIDTIVYDENNKVWNVKLSAASEDTLTDRIQTILKKFKDTDMNLIFAELLIRMGLYIQCQKYLKNRLDSYGNQHEHSAKINEFIAWSYEAENKYDQAIAYYEEAFHLFSSSNRWEDAARVTNLIALCYCKTNHKDLARQYNTKASDILKNQTNLPETHCQFGKIMVCLGDIEDDQSLARDYFQQALNIFQNPSLIACQCQSHEKELANVYEIMASQYRAEQNYSQAIEYYQQSEKLRSKHVTLREERMAYGRSLFMLSNSYTNLRDDDAAQMYLLKYYKFIDNDLIELIYGHDLNATDGALSAKAAVHSSENQLIYELRSLQLLNAIEPKNYENIIERHLNIGEIYTKAKHYDWAREHYDKAYELCHENISSEHVKAQFLFEMGCRAAAAAENNTKDALKFANEALQIQLLILNNDHVDIGFSYYLLSQLYDYSKQYDNGLTYCQKAIEIFEKYIQDEEDHEFRVLYQYAICCHLNATMYQKKHDLIKSNEYSSKTVNHLESFLSDMNTATNFLEYFMSDMNIPASYLERFVYLSKMPDSYCLLANCYLMMAKNYSKLSDNETSIIYHKKVLDTLEKHSKINPILMEPHDHNNEILEALQSLGTLYQAQMDYEQSSFYYEKAIIHYESQLPNQFGLYAECVMKLTMCYLQMGKSQIDTAIECILKIIDNENRTESESACHYFFYGSTLMLKGDYEMSMEILNKALVYAQENKSLLIHIQKTLSLCCCEIADYQQAITFANLSIQTHRELYPQMENEHTVGIYYIIAYCFFRLDNIKEALSNAATGQTIVDKLSPTQPIQIEKASIYSMLALIHSKQRNNRKADKYSKIALNICEQLVNSKDESIHIEGIFENLGELFINQNNFQKARIYYEKALQSYQQQLVDNHPKIQHLQSVINDIPGIENMEQEPQQNFINYIYRRFFSFKK